MEDFGYMIFFTLVALLCGILIGMNTNENYYKEKLCNYKGGKYINKICVSEDNYIDINE